MRSTGQKRLRLAREFGRTGVWLALVLTVSMWMAVAVALTPARTALGSAERQLLELDARLADAQTTLAPFDVLARPETLGAIQTLNDLAERAQALPLVDTMFGQQNLRDAVTLTADWQTTLRNRPPLPALNEARQEVQDWRGRVKGFQERLTFIGLAFCLLFTLLGTWFGAGQWALYQRATERLRSIQRAN